MTVLTRTACDRHPPSRNGQMKSCRRDVDTSRSDHLAVARVRCRQVACTFEDLREHAARAIGEVKGDENSGGKVLRNVFDHALQRTDPAGRSADNDDVVVRHGCGAAKSGAAVERYASLTVLLSHQ